MDGENLIMETSSTGRRFQWQKNGVDIVDGEHYVGTNTRQLTVNLASHTSEGVYDCWVDGSVKESFKQILSKCIIHLYGL